MTTAEEKYQVICDQLIGDRIDVSEGKMMTAPGLKYKTKVFVFFYNDMMVFRVGKDFIPEDYGIVHYSYLSPFKNKPPMKGWLEVPERYQEKWEELAYFALNLMHNAG